MQGTVKGGIVISFPVSATGARFTAVGVITPDPASVESVLAWANRLQDRVQLSSRMQQAHNQTSATGILRSKRCGFGSLCHQQWSGWNFDWPSWKIPRGSTEYDSGRFAARQNSVDELKRASIVMRAESYRRRLFSEFDRAKEMFLP